MKPDGVLKVSFNELLRKPILIALVLMHVMALPNALATSARSGLLCLSVFYDKGSIHYGKFREDLSNSRIHVWRLGSGAMAQVYRVYDRETGDSHIEKVYQRREPSGYPGLSIPEIAKQDSITLKWLGENLNLAEVGIRVVRVLDVEKGPLLPLSQTSLESTILLEDTVGVILDDYLEDPSIPPETRQKVLDRFVGVVDRVAVVLEKKFKRIKLFSCRESDCAPLVDDDIDPADLTLLGTLRKVEGSLKGYQRIDFGVSSDNIILTPEGEFVLIDPS